ncbi:MAG: hypothetical protein K2X34_11815 [Hyphomonadaceae bacterium]|nr:hypothetical protein [Hyphomonadaceae bacterium]
MRSAPDIITPRNRTRHRRIAAWFALKLQWLVFVCSVWMTTGWRGESRQLNQFARAAQEMVLMRAAEMRRFSLPRTVHRFGRRERQTNRKLAGSALRRATRGRDHASRLFAILALIRDVDAHAARLLRRLRRGMTRLRVIDPVAEKGPACVAGVRVVAGGYVVNEGNRHQAVGSRGQSRITAPHAHA